MADITSNLVAHYGLQDKAASTVVVAAVGTNGTLNSAGNTNANSSAGPGGLWPLALGPFDGINDTIDCNSNYSANGASVMSVGCWVYRSAAGSHQLFGWRASSTANFLVAFSNDNKIYNSIGSAFPATAASAATGWIHLGGVFNGSGSPKQKIYVNGELATLTGTQTSATTLPAAMGNLFVNRHQLALIGTGAYADLRAYSRELAADDWAAIYRLGTNFLANSPAFSGAYSPACSPANLPNDFLAFLFG